MERISPENTRRTSNPELQKPIQQKGSTTTPYLTDVVWEAVQWGWQQWTQDYLGPQKAMEGYFVSKEYSPAQKLAYLASDWRSLGLSKEGLTVFIEKLLYASEGNVLKDEFHPIFGKFKAFSEIPEFAQALSEPDSLEGKRVLISLTEALRTDLAYLKDKTMKVMTSSLPIDQKAVYLMLFLSLTDVEDEDASACYAKIPEKERAFFKNEDEIHLNDVSVSALKEIVLKKLTPLPVLEVMQSFQTEGLGKVVTQLHQIILDKTLHQPLLNLQVIVKEEKEKRKLQTEQIDLGTSIAPGTKVEYKLFSILGTEFNHFTECKESKPCGDVATQALTRMIAQFKKKQTEKR